MSSRENSPRFRTRRPLTDRDSQECMRILTEVFGHSAYKGKQKEIVEATYAGADVLVVAPTGMGKSLCFQIPAVADKRGLSVVISPLLALMQNQLEGLRRRNIEVVALNSQVPLAEQALIKKRLQEYDTRIKLLYVTPERMCSEEFRPLLDAVYDNHNLNRLVVDEAHCISEWGHNFREEYRRLGRFRDRYPDVPIMGLTATATPAVQRDIIKSLKLDKDHLFEAMHPFNRPNLYYEVRYLSNPTPIQQMAEISDYITTLHRRRGEPSSGIIYCRFRKTCDEMVGFLRQKGLNASPYHRGIPSSNLEATLKGWTQGERGKKINIVVATIAFGLGIDKPDVRYIIHYDLPKSFEGYYQETGRAGRDGIPSKCILYYSREDAIRVKKYVQTSDPNRPQGMTCDEPSLTQMASGSLDALIQFAESETLCRHIGICRYFGERIEENETTRKTYCDSMCDICKYPDKAKIRRSRLSSNEAAVANVPFSRTVPIVTDDRPSNGGMPAGLQNNRPRRSLLDRPSFGAQKRGADDEGPVPMKKTKSAYMPVLVTKPFNSAASLSKPFRPPGFVDRSAESISNQSACDPVGKFEDHTNKRNDLNSKTPLVPPCLPVAAVDMNDEEDLPIDLPHVDIVWAPEQSTKAPLSDRQKELTSIRSSLHKVLNLSHQKENMWGMISSTGVSEKRKSEIIFRVAVNLEAVTILLSSTLKGYRNRIGWNREHIQVLSDLDNWDSDNTELDSSQEIIQLLRQYSCC